MTTATNNLKVTPETAANDSSLGILLPCPKCGEEECSVTLDLADMDTCLCRNCEEEFSLGTIRAIVDRWEKVLRWVDLFPTI